jgi:hypothetical protein
MVVEAIMQRLDSPELAHALAGRPHDSAAAELSDGLAGDQEQLDELAAMFGKPEISARERRAREPIERRMQKPRGS